jgi:hypothetical protein
MRGKDQGRGGARTGRARAPGWAGPHCGSKSRGTHNHRSEFNSRSKIRNETKQHTRLNTTSDKRNMIRHDATPMST